MKNLALITATVTPPPNVPNLVHVDPQQRLADYRQALDFYVDQLDVCLDGIVFVENSLSNIDSLKDLVESKGCSDRVEFISFQGLDYSPSCGRAYGEFKLVDYAMRNSVLLNCQDKHFIWKITGRYIVRNIQRIVGAVPSNIDFLCNCRNYPRKWADMFLLGWNDVGYQKAISGIYELFDQRLADVAPEQVWRPVIDKLGHEISIMRRFPVVPIVEGTRGTYGDDYAGWSYRLKTCIRQGMKIMFPSVWI